MDYAVNDTLRAMHAVDLPFFFARPDTAAAAEPIGPATPATAALRHRLPDEMAGGLLCFVRQGRPGWPQYDRAGRQTMIFGIESHMQAHPLGPRKTFWENSLLARFTGCNSAKG